MAEFYLTDMERTELFRGTLPQCAAALVADRKAKPVTDGEGQPITGILGECRYYWIVDAETRGMSMVMRAPREVTILVTLAPDGCHSALQNAVFEALRAEGCDVTPPKPTIHGQQEIIREVR
jgi:hypothetical protein